MSTHFRRPFSMPDSRSGPVTQSRPIRVQNSWATKTCMTYRWPGKRPSLFSLGPGAARNDYHIQAENEANTVKGRPKRWWETVLVIFFVPLIKLYLNPGLLRHTSQKPSFFAKPFYIGLPVPWKLQGSRLIQSLLRFVALNKLLYATALCKQ